MKTKIAAREEGRMILKRRQASRSLIDGVRRREEIRGGLGSGPADPLDMESV